MGSRFRTVHSRVVFSGTFLLAVFSFILFFGAERSATAALMDDVVALCSQNEEDRSACYEREVPQLYPKISVEDLFTIIRGIRERDSLYQFCHVLAHKIGERVVAEDPTRWVEFMQLNPTDGLCSNGFIHGVVGGRFRAEVLDEATLEKHILDFSRACEPRVGWKPSALDQAICYHGMGHLYMFITDAVVPQALSLCERTARGGNPQQDFRRVCREGVFMQIYQPLEPDDFLLIERMPERPTRETVRSFCARYEVEEYEGACLRESWPFFREEIMRGGGIEAFCGGQPNAREEEYCYESAFSILGRMTLGEPDTIMRACDNVPEGRRQLCYNYGAQVILEEHRVGGEEAIALCEGAPERYRHSCLESLAAKVRFNFSDGLQARAFCELLPREIQDHCQL